MHIDVYTYTNFDDAMLQLIISACQVSLCIFAIPHVIWKSYWHEPKGKSYTG